MSLDSRQTSVRRISIVLGGLIGFSHERGAGQDWFASCGMVALCRSAATTQPCSTIQPDESKIENMTSIGTTITETVGGPRDIVGGFKE